MYAIEWDEALTQEVKKFAIDVGADKVGIAESELAESSPHGHCSPSKIMKDAKAIVAFCLKYPDAALECDMSDDLIHGGVFIATQRAMNDELMRISLKITKFLENKGYDATPLAPDIPRDEMRWAGALSVRYIAQLAGLGEIGASNLLLTPEWGPRVQLACVVTSAPLKPDGPQLLGKVCKKCFDCAELCPTRAISREKYPPYNFSLNRCFWASLGWRRLTRVEEPPKDWVDAKPNALIMVPAYSKKYPQIRTYQEWHERLGDFPYCAVCMAVCKVGKESARKTKKEG